MSVHAYSPYVQLDERDLVVGNVYRKLMEIESRLLPCGLHVVGVMPTAEEAVATLVSIGEIDRPDNNPPVKGLPGIMVGPCTGLMRPNCSSLLQLNNALTPSLLQARAIGRDIEEIYRNANRGLLADVDLLQQITEACRDCVREFVRGEQWGALLVAGVQGPGAGYMVMLALILPPCLADRTGLDGRIGQSWLTVLSKWTGFYEDPLQRALRGTPFAAASRADLLETFKYLEFCLGQVRGDAVGGRRLLLCCYACSDSSPFPSQFNWYVFRMNHGFLWPHLHAYNKCMKP
jgi:magnesium chelatase subunit H